jgi:iron complex outermembrane receptor protein
MRSILIGTPRRRNRFSKNILTPLLFLCAATLFSRIAPAQQASSSELEEVVVTAQKRSENIRDVPMTVTVFEGKSVELRGLTGLSDYAKFVPGIIFSPANNGEYSGPDIIIRGVANSRLYDFETSIATATTGFVFGDMPVYAFDPDLTDIQRIEVLKGPQGTLYGAAAMGGIVKIVPNAPQFDAFSGQIFGGTSAVDNGGGAGGVGWTGALVLNAPLSDIFALRVSFHSSTNPGYVNLHLLSGSPKDQYGPDPTVSFGSQNTNAYGASEFLKNVNGSRADGGRVALRLKPNDQFESTLTFMHESKSEDSLPNYEPSLASHNTPLVAEQFLLQPDATNYSLGSLEASYDFGGATLHSVTGWLDRRFQNIVDLTGITYGALGGNGLVPLPTPTPNTFDVDTQVESQELRLQGSKEDLFWPGSSIDWTIGGFYQRENREALGNVTVGSAWLTSAVAPLTPPPSGTQTVWAGKYDSTYTNKAGFADVSLHLNRQVTLSLGARHSAQDVNSTRLDYSDVYSSAPPAGTSIIHEPVSESKTTPRAAVTFAATKDVNLYAAYSTGYRIGGSNPIGALDTPGCQIALRLFGINDPAAAQEFKSDNIRNVEAGLKGVFLDHRISANFSVFRVDWTDLQTTVSLSQYSNGCGATFVSNTGGARINGFEEEIRALITDHWQVALSGQYATGKIVAVVPGSSGILGAPLENAPKTQVSAGIEYNAAPRPDWTVTAMLDGAYVGPRNLSNTNTPPDPNYQLPGYFEANLRLTAFHDHWEYSTYIANLTDAIPQLSVYQYPGGPGIYPGSSTPQIGTQRFVTTSAPRTIGVSARLRF